ncbi:MAG: hypothetical protein ACOX8B_03495 [Lachnospiraceae bacterium]|jgi:hypothetical protein
MGKMIESSADNPFGEEEYCEKVYVKVIAEFDPERGVIPRSFFWEDGQQYFIDRVIGRERCASRKAGGVGLMYTVRIRGKEAHLYLEDDNRWFLEKARR